MPRHLGLHGPPAASAASSGLDLPQERDVLLERGSVLRTRATTRDDPGRPTSSRPSTVVRRQDDAVVERPTVEELLETSLVEHEGCCRAPISVELAQLPSRIP